MQADLSQQLEDASRVIQEKLPFNDSSKCMVSLSNTDLFIKATCSRTPSSFATCYLSPRWLLCLRYGSMYLHVNFVYMVLLLEHHYDVIHCCFGNVLAHVTLPTCTT